EVPEREAPSLEAGQAVHISVDALRGETFGGEGSRGAAARNMQARSLALEAMVPNDDGRPRPRFFGHGDAMLRPAERARPVPRSAVSTFAGVTKMFVIDDGVAHEHEVRLGIDLGDGWVEVTEGASRGMQVATSGLARLADGVHVNIRADVPPGA